MAMTTIGVDDYKSGDLELLSSGNFSDVEVTCGNTSWKCHGAILVPRCLWFRKALVGPFKEATTRQVILVEEDPICVDIVLKHIYGGGLDIMNSVSKEHFVEHCVSLWHTADFFLLEALKRCVEIAVRGYCDKRMKELCTSPYRPTWRHSHHLNKLSPWALDLVEGLRQAYKWRISDLKAVLMEFIWVTKDETLESGIASVLFDHLKDTPSFTDDFLGGYVSDSWASTSVWAPTRDKSDWEPNVREHSDILRVFAHRVMTRLDIEDLTEAATVDYKIIVTFIDRRGARKLIDIETHVLALENRYPYAEIRRADLAGMPFPQQAHVVTESVVLAGVHGAGLTHGLWMKERSAMVEILPEGFMHKGFRNLASALRHEYFSAHGVQPEQD